ncbi:MAG: LacI family DNA-binding transcriptional regulator [Caldilineales bacterium]|nr:LacI family DNA-binding transcriptional regulator [Caldilineales bacterium]
MAVTIKDIAQQTGKSITTVSRALADYDDVSPATKELVRRVADELGYVPNTVARSLQKRRTDIIGLILPTFGPRFSDPFFSEFLAGVGNRAAESGYDLLVSTQAPGDGELEAYQRKVNGRRVDGLIVVRTRRNDARIDYLRETGFPFVAFGRTEGVLDYPLVDEDSALGTRMLVEHMAALGHRQFAYISPPAELMLTHYRLQGLNEGLADADIRLDPSRIVTSDLTQRGGFRAMEELLDRPERPTAVIGGNDLMAIGAMSAAQHRGLAVGRDIAIAGFDDIPMAEHAHPPLTTVHQPIYQIGGMVSDMLIKLLLDEEIERPQIVLQPTLVVRRSTGAEPTPLLKHDSP